jgi:hypothetical protein
MFSEKSNVPVSRAALRVRRKRDEETLEQRKERQNNDALRTAAKRQKETPDQRKERRKNQALRTAARRGEETPDQTQKRLEEKAKRTAARREEETLDQTQQRLEENAKRKALNRISHNRKRRENVKQEVYVENEEKMDEVPNIAQFVETSDSLKCAFQYLHKTRIGDDENIRDGSSSSRPGMDFPLRGMFHQANICVCCDRFITGVSEIRWIKKQMLLFHHRRLIDDELPEALKNCYKVFDPDLQHLLLSPRARVNIRDEYICCSQCSDSLRSHMRNK